MSWPEHGSYQHGVQEGARQVVAYLNRILERGFRFDQLAQRVGELHESMEGGDYLGAGLNYTLPDQKEEPTQCQE